MKEVILLNSGGFDSVVLAHDLVADGETKVVSLFFDYGQINKQMERKCAKAVAQKLDMEFIDISLPKINWSKSTLYSNTDNKTDSKAQYVEMRNLIFLSYAFSLAESRGIKEIYVAFLKSEQGFIDVSEEFVKTLNEITPDIQVIAPYNKCTKVDLGYLARYYEIKKTEFFSCNTPKVNKLTGTITPCNECGDCDILNKIFYEIVENHTPIQSWLSEPSCTPEFQANFMKAPIEELRFLLNNDCQFNCKHCFYGFKDTKSPIIPYEEMKKHLGNCIERLNIKNVHFSGKEPFFDKTIFNYMDFLRENYPNVTYDVVTNGVNVIPFMPEIKRSGLSKIYLSVDSLKSLTIRPSNVGIIDTINALNENNIPTQIFIDCTSGNYKEIGDIVLGLYNHYNIKEFHIRPVMPIGNGIQLSEKGVTATLEQLDYVFKELISIPKKEDLRIEFLLKTVHTRQFLEAEDKCFELTEKLYDIIDCMKLTTNNVTLIGEFYCGPYESNVTLTPDGYLLGCATEVASKVYDKISVGNVKDNDPLDLVLQGKQQTLLRMSMNEQRNNGYVIPSCYHSFYKI